MNHGLIKKIEPEYSLNFGHDHDWLRFLWSKPNMVSGCFDLKKEASKKPFLFLNKMVH